MYIVTVLDISLLKDFINIRYQPNRHRRYDTAMSKSISPELKDFLPTNDNSRKALSYWLVQFHFLEQVNPHGYITTVYFL